MRNWILKLDPNEQSVTKYKDAFWFVLICVKCLCSTYTDWDVMIKHGRGGGFSLVLMDWCLIHHLLLVFYFTPSKMWFAYFTWYFTCPIKMWFAASAGDQIVFSSNNIEQWLAMTRGKCLKTQSYSTSPSSKGWFLSFPMFSICKKKLRPVSSKQSGSFHHHLIMGDVKNPVSEKIVRLWVGVRGGGAQKNQNCTFQVGTKNCHCTSPEDPGTPWV